MFHSFVFHDYICRYAIQGIFNYITTGAFTPVGPLLAPIVKHISKKSTLLKKLHPPALSYPLTFSTFHLTRTVRTGRGSAKGGMCSMVVGVETPPVVR
jgi:hypothetical protein